MTGKWFDEHGKPYDGSEFLAVGSPTPAMWGYRPTTGPFFVLGSNQGSHGPFYRHGSLVTAVRGWSDTWMPEQPRSSSMILDSRGFIVVGICWTATTEPRWFGCSRGWAEVHKQATKASNLAHFAGVEGKLRLALIESSCKGEFDDLLEIASFVDS